MYLTLSLGITNIYGKIMTVYLSRRLVVIVRKTDRHGDERSTKSFVVEQSTVLNKLEFQSFFFTFPLSETK